MARPDLAVTACAFALSGCLMPEGGLSAGTERVLRSTRVYAEQGSGTSAGDRFSRDDDMSTVGVSVEPFAFAWPTQVAVRWRESPPPWLDDEFVRPGTLRASIQGGRTVHTPSGRKTPWWLDFTSIEGLVTKVFAGLATVAAIIAGRRYYQSGNAEPAQLPLPPAQLPPPPAPPPPWRR